MASVVGKLLLLATERSVVRRLVTESPPGRALASRFVAGESLEEAAAVTAALNSDGFTVSLDHLGEHVAETGQAIAAKDDYLACLDRIAVDGLDSNISIKLTQLGLQFDAAMATELVDELATRAVTVGTSVTIDMEEASHTSATLEIYEAAQRRHGNMGVALQAYLKRTGDDLERIAPLGGHIRLCKGAYLEPPEIAFQGRAEVSASFDRLLEALLGHEETRPAIATHDEARIDVARQLLSTRAATYEFQMLYGVRGPLQRDLLAAGYPVRVYVPYGVAWYPYLTRRLAERPANVVFFLRAAAGRS